MAKEVAKVDNTPMSVIDSVSVGQVQQELQAIDNFQKIVKKTLKEGVDFDKIPGTGNKPTMLKPGAEKILMILGLTSKYEIADEVVDNQKGFFSYTIKSYLYKGDQLITEGLGNANTRERKYIKQDPFTMQNTVLKMAKKRAQVDAALTVGSLSNAFTQDVEDMGGYQRQPASKVAPKKISEDQKETIVLLVQSLAKAQNITSDELLKKEKIPDDVSAFTDTQANRCIGFLTKKLAALQNTSAKKEPAQSKKSVAKKEEAATDTPEPKAEDVQQPF